MKGKFVRSFVRSFFRWLLVEFEGLAFFSVRSGRTIDSIVENESSLRDLSFYAMIHQSSWYDHWKRCRIVIEYY